MATVDDVIDTLKGKIDGFLANLVVETRPITIQVASGWPTEAKIQEVGKNPDLVAIGIYDKSSNNDLSGWIRRSGMEVIAKGIVSSLDKKLIAHNGTATLTLAYADGSTVVKDKDGVSLVVDCLGQRVGATACAVTGDTLAILATKLATDINSRIEVQPYVSAVAAGSTVVVTGVSSTPAYLATHTGNVARVYKDVGKMTTDLQVVCWFGDRKVRRAVADILEIKLPALRKPRSFVAPSGHFINVLGTQRFNVPNDADVPADVYRRDFGMQVSFAITDVDLAYSILVSKANLQKL